MTGTAEEEWRAAGLLRDDAPGRATLLRYLADQGCTVAEMVAAEARGRLYALAGDRLLQPGGLVLTLVEVAERLGADTDEVARVWRALGLPVRDWGTPVAAASDLDVLPAYFGLKALVGPDEALGVLRVIGSSARRSPSTSPASRWSSARPRSPRGCRPGRVRRSTWC